jgi:hypothetical protein
MLASSTGIEAFPEKWAHPFDFGSASRLFDPIRFG